MNSVEDFPTNVTLLRMQNKDNKSFFDASKNKPINKACSTVGKPSKQNLNKKANSESHTEHSIIMSKSSLPSSVQTSKLSSSKNTSNLSSKIHNTNYEKSTESPNKNFQKKTNKKKDCQVHQKPIEGFCEKCMRLICVDCVFENHKTHNIYSLNKASD